MTREELIALYGQECRTCKRWAADTCLGYSGDPHDRDIGNLGICQLGPVPMWGHEGCDKYEVLEAPHDAVAEGGGSEMRTHELKCWPEHFTAILDGSKTVELRLNDRGYAVGDLLILKEFQYPVGYSGRDCVREVTHVVRDTFGTWLQPDVVAMSLRRVRD